MIAFFCTMQLRCNWLMPAFGKQLSDDQIRSILDYIKSAWPARVRAAQAERTRADEQARKQ